MKVVILCVGKTDVPYIETGLELYTRRLSHYIQLEWKVIPEQKIWKKLGADARKKAEGVAILEQITPGDKVILLDENGKSPGSEAFAHQLEKIMASGTRRLILVIGGAFGFSKEVYAAIPDRLSLSKMTFSHQMVRLFLVEQIYRAFTILRNEPYHNS